MWGAPGSIGGCFWSRRADSPLAGSSAAGKGLCVLIATDIPGASEVLCEDFGGEAWFPGATVSGGVPALPKVAYGVLALVLLAGTLTLLTLHGNRS